VPEGRCHASSGGALTGSGDPGHCSGCCSTHPSRSRSRSSAVRCVRCGQTISAAADDDDWAVGVRRAVLAHRAEEHGRRIAMTLQPTTRMVGACDGLDQLGGRMASSTEERISRAGRSPWTFSMMASSARCASAQGRRGHRPTRWSAATPTW